MYFKMKQYKNRPTFEYIFLYIVIKVFKYFIILKLIKYSE